MNTRLKHVIKQLFSAIVAQGFSLVQSAFMSLVVAKILDNEIFAWWQWFLFLAGLTHYIHIGVGEGILLQYGGTTYNDLDHRALSGRFWSYMLLQFVVTGCLITLGWGRYGLTDEGICLILAALFMIASNLSYFMAQLLIATNQTSYYSKAVITNKACMFAFSLGLIVSGYRDYILFAVLYCAGQYIELAICCHYNKTILRAKPYGFLRGITEMLRSARVGIILSISSLAANMVSNIGRACVKITGSMLNFGALSFSNSLSNFFLMFIRQIGTVIFPFLRRMKQEQQCKLFALAHRAISFITLGLLLIYFPVRIILENWLSNYHDSLIYLGYIMPIVVLDAQMSAINNPYFNALSKEKVLLRINLLACFAAAVVSIFAITIMNSLDLVALSITIGMAVKDYIGIIYLGRGFGLSMRESVVGIVQETLMISLFLVAAQYFTLVSFAAYAGGYILYIAIHRRMIGNIYRTIRTMLCA